MLQSAAYPAPTYGIAFAISSWCWLLFEIWVFSRDRGTKKKSSRGGGQWLIPALAIGITATLNMPGIAPAFDFQGHFALYFVFRIVLMWAGILFRLWSSQALGAFFSTSLTIQERHELITKGPYKYLRNPSYTGALMTLVGIGFAVGSWISVAVLLLTGLIAYAWRIRAEESMLLEAFGPTFEDYIKRTWALIPFVW